MPPKLMPHQEEAVKFLEERDGCGLLAMEPGTGKTLSALEYLTRGGHLPALVIAPVSLLGMWAGELARWYPELKVNLIRGDKKKRMDMYLTKADVYLIGYETFRMDFAVASKLPVVACVADETGKVRTPTAKVSKAFRSFLPSKRIALDGTPVSNTVADLWNVSEWLQPKVFFGNWWAFRKRYAIMNGYIPGKIDGWREVDKIVATATKRIFWKKKVDVLKDLPAMTQTDLTLPPTDEEKRFYKQIKTELRLEFEGQEITITNALALLMRLRQAANGVFTERPTVGTKTRALLDLIETLPPGEKLVVFSQFETVIAHLSTLLGKKAVCITGKMTAEEREASVKVFESEPGVQIILMTSAGEKGLNLQCASYMVQFDLVWSAAAEEQRVGRIWRHGQTKPITVWNLLMEGTVDMHMRRILDRKKKLADNIASGEVLTYEEIEEILT